MKKFITLLESKYIEHPSTYDEAVIRWIRYIYYLNGKEHKTILELVNHAHDEAGDSDMSDFEGYPVTPKMVGDWFENYIKNK
jgi:hypothetical protein